MDSERNVRVSSLLTEARSRPGAARHALSSLLLSAQPLPLGSRERLYSGLPPRHRPRKLRHSKAKVPSQVRRLPPSPSIDRRRHLQDVTFAPFHPFHL